MWRGKRYFLPAGDDYGRRRSTSLSNIIPISAFNCRQDWALRKLIQESSKLYRKGIETVDAFYLILRLFAVISCISEDLLKKKNAEKLDCNKSENQQTDSKRISINLDAQNIQTWSALTGQFILIYWISKVVVFSNFSRSFILWSWRFLVEKSCWTDIL